MTRSHGRAVRFAAPAAALALLLSACAGGTNDGAPGAEPTAGGETAAGGDPVTLRMVWWGGEARTDATLEAIAAFEEAHPDITVEHEALGYDGYHDKLSTQVAAGAAPDVQQLQGEFMAQYGAQGILLPLTDVDTSNLDEGTTSNGFIDGEQVAVPTGLSTLAIVADPALFEQAGVDLPDDSTWTWDDYLETARQISEGTPDGVFGTKSLGWDITEMATWVAQQGGELWTEDGQMGATVEEVASLFRFAKRLVDEGAAPSASESAEQLTLSPEQSGVATGRYAMQLDAVSNFPALENASGGGLELLRLPAPPGQPGEHSMMFVAAQYWAVAAGTEHPVEAQMLVDYLSNDPEAGRILGVTRSTPANSEFREAVLPDLDETEQAVVEFMNEVSDEVVPARLAPAGAATFTRDMQRYAMEVLFGRLTPEEAAQALISETQAKL